MKIIDDSVELEKKLLREKFLSYQDWIEIKLLEEDSEKEYCYRCNKPLEPLTPIDPEFYTLPCWECTGRKRSEREIRTENIIRNIRDYYMSRVLGDRYLQLFIVDSIYFSNTLPHKYSVFKKVIGKLNPPSRNDIWFLDWKTGFPKIISQQNLEGLKIVNLSSLYKNLELGKTKIQVENYEILMPEEVKLDRHRTRYGIFSKGNDNRKSKRIKVGERNYKLYNTDNDKIKSLFKVLKNGEEIAFRSLSYQDYVILKLAVMRDRTFLKFIFDIFCDLSRQVGVYRDSIFLKNTVTINPKKTEKINFIWTPISNEFLDDYVNISLL